MIKKMKSSQASICLILLICCIHLDSTEAAYKKKNYLNQRRQQSTTVSDAINEFAFALQKTFPIKDNIVFSPWAIAFALGMIAMGASGNTFAQMQEAMHWTNILPNDNIHYGFKQLSDHLLRSSQSYEMKMFSTILVQENSNVTSSYKILLQRYYDADVHDVDFATLGPLVTEWINVWTALKTGGKIKSILTSVPDSNTVMLLLTANYFKGQWVDTFNVNDTTLSEFRNDNEKTVMVDMMHATRNMSVYSGNFAVDAVDVPMKGHISFLFILPERPSDMQVLQSNLSAAFLSDLLKDMSEEPVRLGIPKVHASSRIELQESLEALGIRDLFSPEADLSKMSSNGGLSVKEVVHKASLDIDEEGAEATSVTVISIISRKVYRLEFNRPFIFIIRETPSNTILFMGRISNL